MQNYSTPFDSGFVSDSWTLDDILPIYKNKRNIRHPENYRPITILSCFGKLFTSILNTRITKYVEENEKINSCQVGFRKGFSTTDNLFVLQSLFGPRQANLVLIAYASSEGSGEPAHPRSLARTFAARSYK